MIIKRINSKQRRRAAETNSYILDTPRDGEKVICAAALNCFSKTLEEAQAEMAADDCAYKGDGEAVVHWMVSWREDEKPTPAQIDEFWRDFIKDQGMEGHKLIYAAHDNTSHLHSHATLLRVKPEADEKGQYTIQHFGAREKRQSGMNHEIFSARATMKDFEKKYGFAADFEAVRQAPAPDAIRLSQKIEAAEARTGEPDPRRILAEKAVDALREAKSWKEARALCDKADITLVLTDRTDINGKITFGGFIKADDGTGHKVKLSALPLDCRYKSLDARFSGQIAAAAPAPKALTANSAKFHARQAFNAASSMREAEITLAEKGISIERQGKTGAYLRYGNGENDKIKLSALGGKYSLLALEKKYNGQGSNNNALLHESQSPVNALSRKDALNMQSDRAEARASGAQERAAGVAAESIQAKTLSEALDDAFALATAQDAVRKAKIVAAEAEKRAQEAEERLREKQEKKHMNDLTPESTKPKTSAAQEKKAAEPSINIEQQQPKNSAAGEAAPAAENAVQKKKFGFTAPKKTGGKFGIASGSKTKFGHHM